MPTLLNAEDHAMVPSVNCRLVNRLESTTGGEESNGNGPEHSTAKTQVVHPGSCWHSRRCGAGDGHHGDTVRGLLLCCVWTGAGLPQFVTPTVLVN